MNALLVAELRYTNDDHNCSRVLLQTCTARSPFQMAVYHPEGEENDGSCPQIPWNALRPASAISPLREARPLLAGVIHPGCSRQFI